MKRDAFAVLGLLAALAVPTPAGSGEFEVVHELSDASPIGVHGVSFEVGGTPGAGVLSLDVDHRGRASGVISVSSAEAVAFRGRYRGDGASEALALRGVGSHRALRIRLSRATSDDAWTGRVSGRRGPFDGAGGMRFDLEDPLPLTADFAGATRNSRRAIRRGAGSVEIGEGTVDVTVRASLRRRVDRLHVRGRGYVLTARGEILDDRMRVDRFRLTTHGVTRRGAGTIAFRPNGPDVALFLASGHPVDASIGGLLLSHLTRPYLDETAGADLEEMLDGAGLSYETFSFVDHGERSEYGEGFASLVDRLRDVYGNWIDGRAIPTRIVMVGHGHGCVRTHAATRHLPDVPVSVLIDLGATSCMFATGHDHEPFFDLMADVQVGERTLAIHDVVFPSVSFNLEAQSGALCVEHTYENYDRTTNVRSDGSTTGVSLFEARSDLFEVHQPGGSTMTFVKEWLRERLGDLGLRLK